MLLGAKQPKQRGSGRSGCGVPASCLLPAWHQSHLLFCGSRGGLLANSLAEVQSLSGGALPDIHDVLARCLEVRGGII